MFSKEEFFSKINKELKSAKLRGRKYHYLFSVILPCGIEEFEIYYQEYNLETRECNHCNPVRWDIVFNLPIDK